MSEFIFMLTKEDQTVADALSVYDEVRGTPLRYVGFKDIGQPASVLRELATRIRADGRTAVLEVVSIDRDSEVRSVQAGLEMDVDLLMGGRTPTTCCRSFAGRASATSRFPGASSAIPAS